MNRIRGEEGITLVEMVVGLTISAIVLTTALIFLQQQQVLFSMGTNRLNAVQGYRYAIDLVERNLRTLGVGVQGEQPLLLYVGEDEIAFNADYASRVRDLSAVYVVPDAPPEAVTALGPAHAIDIPEGGGFLYPRRSYPNSAAETIVLSFEPDASTERVDDFVLYRQVNDQEPEVVARSLLRDQGRPFFRYLLHTRDAEGSPVLDSIPPDDLPLAHTAPVHGAVGDITAVDSIVAVRISLAATNGRQGAEEAISAVQRVVRMPNMTATALRTCGDEPQLGVSLGAQAVVSGTGTPGARLTWSPAIDQLAGERDVSRYLVWRRVVGSAEWGAPILSVPFSAVPYDGVDQPLTPGTTYEYRLQATDCTPSLSEPVVSAPVSIPPLP